MQASEAPSVLAPGVPRLLSPQPRWSNAHTITVIPVGQLITISRVLSVSVISLGPFASSEAEGTRMLFLHMMAE